MPEYQRKLQARLRPGVPVVNMQVGPTNSAGSHLDQDIVRPYLGNGGLNQFCALFGTGFAQGAHSIGHQPSSSSSLSAEDCGLGIEWNVWRSAQSPFFIARYSV